MYIYMNINTGNICLLTFVSSHNNKFTMEYENFEVTITVRKGIEINDGIALEYEEIGYL